MTLGWRKRMVGNPALRYGVIFLCGMLATSATAQQPLKTLLVDVDHRSATSLNGNWHYLLDTSGVGLYDADGKVRDDGYARNQHPIMVGERNGFQQEYDFANALTLKFQATGTRKIQCCFTTKESFGTSAILFISRSRA